MCAEVYRTGEPYRLGGNRIIFASWYYIRPCSFGWYDEQDRCVSVIGEQGPFDAHIKRFNEPWGVRLRVENAQCHRPVFNTEYPWEEGGISINTILKDGGIYRAWGSTNWGDLKKRGRGYFCYFESDDGFNWNRPNCGIIEYEGNSNNNLLDTDGGTVFIDPAAPGYERYKWISEHCFTRDEYEKYKNRRPQDCDWKSERLDAGLLLGVQGAVSPDGLHWTRIPQPLVMAHSDTQVVAYYDSFSKKYVGYFRDWMVGPQADHVMDDKRTGWLAVGRRTIGRAETDDFRNFPLPEVIIEPGPSMSPSQVFYTNCKTTIPGAPDNHLMFPAVWDQVNDATHIELFSSNNGVIWNPLSNGPVFKTGDFGQWDGGCIFASPNLIELPNGDYALPYTGYNVPHKYPRVNAERSVGYALWPKGRIVGLEALEQGEFTTVAVVPPGERLLINAVTRRAGSIMVEALDVNQQPLAGRSFEDAVPIVGDHYRTSVVWKNHDNLGIEPGQAVILRFKMNQACIYSLDFEPIK
jgi:hypothetical protein